ncbi:nitrile hydratase subunit alpha [Chloroflexi bacterium TSY]|nr:nitrile hydratase subunit alpha [Chloroflexi bacterium TSY]
MTHHHHTNGHIHGEVDAALRTRALEALLVEKGLITTDVIDEVVRQYEEDIGPMNGAKVVARAWTDTAYKEWLLKDGTAAIAEMGYTGRQGAEMVVLENTTEIHNVVVCTLCSCYPWPVLGLPPNWYKSFAYRSRVVREPRAVLKEFGLDLPESVEVRVWDSNSEVRYMVLPQQPEGTDGFSQEELASLITRDAMIGVAKVKAPALANGGV